MGADRSRPEVITSWHSAAIRRESSGPKISGLIPQRDGGANGKGVAGIGRGRAGRGRAWGRGGRDPGVGLGGIQEPLDHARDPEREHQIGLGLGGGPEGVELGVLQLDQALPGLLDPGQVGLARLEEAFQAGDPRRPGRWSVPEESVISDVAPFHFATAARTCETARCWACW